MDFKLIHIVQPDTSAASNRPGRYETCTLDFTIFMESRRRNIEIMEFWEKEEQGRLKGTREAPAYPIARIREILINGMIMSAEPVVRQLDADEEVGVEKPALGRVDD